MMGVLRQALVPDFGKTKPALHHAEDMLDFGAHFRLVAVLGPLSVTERNVPTAFFVGEVFCLWRMLRYHISFACIGRIAPNTSFVTMQQIAQHDRVMNIGRCSYNGVNQFGFAIDTDMSLQRLKLAALKQSCYNIVHSYYNIVGALSKSWVRLTNCVLKNTELFIITKFLPLKASRI